MGKDLAQGISDGLKSIPSSKLTAGRRGI
jgi:hypothetical protein